MARTRVCSAERVGLVIVFNVDQYNYQPHPLATHLDVLMFHVETLNAQTPAGGWVLCGVRWVGEGGKRGRIARVLVLVLVVGLVVVVVVVGSVGLVGLVVVVAAAVVGNNSTTSRVCLTSSGVG